MNVVDAGEATLLGATLRAATQRLQAGGSPTARLDAELLAAHALGLTRVQLYTESQRPLEPGELAAYEALVARRLAHEPVQYIVGVAHFRRLELAVDRRVLIPRPETELLVEWAVEVGVHVHAPRVLDVCTGSGAIALAVADELAGAVIAASDVSADALEVARANGAACGLDVEWLEGDLLAPVVGRTFDIVVSNPPYVPAADLDAIEPNVREYEPHLALFVDGDDATAIAQRIISGAGALLAPGGLLAMEIGMGQHHVVAAAMRSAGFEAVEVRPDLQGIDRAVGGRWPS